MTLKTNKFLYTLSGKNGPYKVMKFDLNGIFIENVGTVNSPKELKTFVEIQEALASPAKGPLVVAKVARKKRTVKKKA